MSDNRYMHQIMGKIPTFLTSLKAFRNIIEEKNKAIHRLPKYCLKIPNKVNIELNENFQRTNIYNGFRKIQSSSIKKLAEFNEKRCNYRISSRILVKNKIDNPFFKKPQRNNILNTASTLKIFGNRMNYKFDNLGTLNKYDFLFNKKRPNSQILLRKNESNKLLLSPYSIGKPNYTKKIRCTTSTKCRHTMSILKNQDYDFKDHFILQSQIDNEFSISPFNFKPISVDPKSVQRLNSIPIRIKSSYEKSKRNLFKVHSQNNLKL